MVVIFIVIGLTEIVTITHAADARMDIFREAQHNKRYYFFHGVFLSFVEVCACSIAFLVGRIFFKLSVVIWR